MDEERTLKHLAHTQQELTGIRVFSKKKWTNGGRRRRNIRWTLNRRSFPFPSPLPPLFPQYRGEQKTNPFLHSRSHFVLHFSTWGFTRETATSGFVLTAEPSSTQLLIAQVCSTASSGTGEDLLVILSCACCPSVSLRIFLPILFHETKRKKEKQHETVTAQLSYIDSHPLLWIVLFCLILVCLLHFNVFLYFLQAFYSFTWWQTWRRMLNISLVSPSILFCLHNPLIKTLGTMF